MITPFGDAGLLVDLEDDRAAHRLAASTDGDPSPPPGIIETVVGLRTVLVHIDPVIADPAGIQDWLARLGSSGPSPGAPSAALPSAAPPSPGASGRVVEMPVTFDGPDLDGVAAAIDADVEEVTRLVTSTELRVAFLGFAPGFAYLVGLPPPLAGIERRSSPRTQVPSGSVALAAGFAAVYPQTTPGGWQLIGHTDLSLFDPSTPPFALLRAGDTVRFTRATDAAQSPSDTSIADPHGAAPTRAPLRATSGRHIEILEPGTLTLMQDAGRRGLAAIGVPAAGAADPDGLRLANRLVGNSDDDAALELTVHGPTIRFSADGYIAVVGDSDLKLDDRSVAADAVVPVAAGQVLAVGALRQHIRSYLALDGGLQGPLTLGSRSSDVLAGLGPGPLFAGDQVDLGNPGHPRGRLAPLPTGPSIHIVRGPHHGAEAELQKLARACWTVDGRSNRVGLRLTSSRSSGNGETLIRPPSPGIPSCGMVNGAIQIPPDGQPIVLMPDHATVGGYPVMATVISADWGALGRLGPGDDVRFALVDLDEARALRREHERLLDGSVSGWFPTQSTS
ncbi:MAG TPA: 5-oxoprolinase/urea amidolyase family protein [Acidimicrobiales bacterium]